MSRWGFLFLSLPRLFHKAAIKIDILCDDLCSFRAFVKFRLQSYLKGTVNKSDIVLLDFSLAVKAAPHECVIRTGQP